MNELASLNKLENKIRLLVDEMKRLKSQQSAEESDTDPASAEKLARIEEKVKSIIAVIDELL